MAETIAPTLPHEFSDTADALPSYTPPTVRFLTLTFSDGNIIEIALSDIVVLVGPNNAGKSVALQELEQWVRGKSRSHVIKSAVLHQTGTSDDFAAYLDRHTKITDQGGSISIKAPGLSVGIGTNDVKSMWPKQISHFAPLFCTRVNTETRITESNPAPGFAVLEDTPSHPIHLLYKNDELEDTISKYFQKAFGKELIVFRLGGNEMPLLVGHRPTLTGGEDRLSRTYNERLLDSSLPLSEQGDGMRSFASVIFELASPYHSLCLALR